LTASLRFRGSLLATAVATAVILLSSGDARCDDVEFQGWIDYNPTWKPGERLTFFGDAGLRRNHTGPRWWRYVARPSVAYDVGAWQIAGGIGNFYNDFAGALHIYELRPWQGAQVHWPASRVRLGHLFRLEERFFFDTDDGNSLFRLRFRYQISTRVVWTVPDSGRSWSSPFSVELFFTFDEKAEERFGEEARVSAGIERGFSRRLSLRLDILWQKTARLFDIYSDNEIYLRLRLFQRF
jgi:hypothetical protein